MSYQVIFTDELCHHGVKGQKWGIRRYQNDDGSLTEVGKKRLSKQYKKLAKKTAIKTAKVSNRLYVDAYNEEAHKMNSGGIDKFNKSQEKKYGKNFASRKGYENDYLKTFNRAVEKKYNKKLYEAFINDESYNKAKQLADKYDMVKWDKLVSDNEIVVKELKKAYDSK